MVSLVERDSDLDRDRVASMADEGGAAAAHVEAQPAVARPSSPSPEGRGIVRALLVATAVLVAVALVLGWATRAPRRDRQ